MVVDQGCLVDCVKFDMKIFITAAYGFHYNIKID